MAGNENQGAGPAIPVKPYFIRALAQWCEDCGYSPYILVQADDEVEVPREFVEEGRIVLDISEEATHNLDIGNDEIRFEARFGEAARAIRIPVRAVLAIFPGEAPQYVQSFPYEPPAAAKPVRVQEPAEKAAEEPARKSAGARPSFIQKVK